MVQISVATGDADEGGTHAAEATVGCQQRPSAPVAETATAAAGQTIAHRRAGGKSNNSWWSPSRPGPRGCGCTLRLCVAPSCYPGFLIEVPARAVLPNFGLVRCCRTAVLTLQAHQSMESNRHNQPGCVPKRSNASHSRAWQKAARELRTVPTTIVYGASHSVLLLRRPVQQVLGRVRFTCANARAAARTGQNSQLHGIPIAVCGDCCSYLQPLTSLHQIDVPQIACYLEHRL